MNTKNFTINGQEVTFTQMPATLGTIRLAKKLDASPEKYFDNIEEILSKSLSYTYKPEDVEAIIDSIPLPDGGDQNILHDIAGFMFFGGQKPE